MEYTSLPLLSFAMFTFCFVLFCFEHSESVSVCYKPQNTRDYFCFSHLGLSYPLSIGIQGIAICGIVGMKARYDNGMSV